MIEEKLKIWAAGFFDGEGSALIEKTGENNYCVVVCVVNSDIRATDIFYNNWANAGVPSGALLRGWKKTQYIHTLGSVFNKKRGYQNAKGSHKVTFNYQDAEVLLSNMLPYLIVKKEQANIILRAIKAIRESDKTYWQTLLPFYTELRHYIEVESPPHSFLR